MQTYELVDLISQHADSDKRYLEFLKVPDLSMGLYILLLAELTHNRRTRRMKSITW